MRAWPFVVCGLACTLGIGGWCSAPGRWSLFRFIDWLFRRRHSGAGLGAAAIAAAPDDVHRVTAAMFTISYSCAVIVPVISGMMWDVSGRPEFAFLPIALCGIILAVLAPAINHVRRAEN